jgi:hypothetical protein
MKMKDIKGQRFGRLVALEPTDRRCPNNGVVMWLCRCDCGNLHIANGNHLRYGRAQGCDCMKNHRRKK